MGKWKTGTMVYGSMQNHGGVIEIESAKGEGSRMNLYFPLCDLDAAADKKEQLNDIVGMGETILLADDNVHVRKTMQEVLQEFGYRVLAVEDGQQALLMFIDHASEIDLVLLDIVMPVMGGVEAAEKLRELKADLPILFLSGYEKKSSSVGKSVARDISILAKPVDLIELSHHIRKRMNK
ncbi:MAG: response regulator [Mariprofundaceae bacterium]|nr:response regulator [Mariprofundaceae bacterium]